MTYEETKDYWESSYTYSNPANACRCFYTAGYREAEEQTKKACAEAVGKAMMEPGAHRSTIEQAIMEVEVE